MKQIIGITIALCVLLGVLLGTSATSTNKKPTNIGNIEISERESALEEETITDKKSAVIKHFNQRNSLIGDTLELKHAKKIENSFSKGTDDTLYELTLKSKVTKTIYHMTCTFELLFIENLMDLEKKATLEQTEEFTKISLVFYNQDTSSDERSNIAADLALVSEQEGFYEKKYENNLDLFIDSDVYLYSIVDLSTLKNKVASK